MSSDDEFIDKIKALAEYSKVAVEERDSEMQICLSVVLPFLNALGYDHVKRHIVAEAAADSGKLRGQKIDYALRKDSNSDEILMLVEAKAVKEKNLAAHHHQLDQYYYNRQDAKIALLTNGIEAWFYADLVTPNRMDKEPFFKFNFQDNTTKEIKWLLHFCREEFLTETVYELARYIISSRKFSTPSSSSSDKKESNNLTSTSSTQGENNSMNQQLIENENIHENCLEKYKPLINFHFLCDEPARTIFEKFITELKKLKVNLNTIPTYIQCYKSGEHIANKKPFISIVPLQKSIKIGLAIKDKSEIKDTENLCKNRSSQNKHGIGGALIKIDEIKIGRHLDDIMKIVQQVYDKHENNAITTEIQDIDKPPPNKRDEAWYELNRNYWSDFKNYLAIEPDGIKLGNPTKWTNQHFKSWRNNTFVLRVNAYDKHIAVSFHVLSESEEVNQKISDYLREKEDSFKSKIDGEYEWKPAQGKKKFSIILRKDADISTQNPEIKNSQFLWLKENLELFYGIFYPLTKDIDIG